MAPYMRTCYKRHKTEGDQKDECSTLSPATQEILYQDNSNIIRHCVDNNCNNKNEKFYHLSTSGKSSSTLSPVSADGNSKGDNNYNDYPKKNKYKILLSYEEAPDHLKFNPYIRTGYRTFLSTKLCLQSVFWWTNETINIWSHLIGCFLFIGLAIIDFQLIKLYADLTDQILVICLLTCFGLCMFLSAVYHIFSCKSEQHYELFLSADYMGIALSLTAIYISSMYYAFWCTQTPRIVYSVISLAMFFVTLVVQIPKLNVSLNAKISILFIWAAYGVIPLGHWIVTMGGFNNELVQLMIPRVVLMYGLCLVAFVIYAAKIPERWLTGKVDFFGHSHNWWHLFVLIAFYHWHNTGIVYAEYRLNNGCHESVLL